MFCSSCGIENEDGARFCKSCGKGIAASGSGDEGPEDGRGQEPPAPSQVPNYLVQAILVTIFCCLPTGIVTIFYAAQVNKKLGQGDVSGALQASKNAKMWIWASVGGGLLTILIVIVAGVFGSSDSSPAVSTPTPLVVVEPTATPAPVTEPAATTVPTVPVTEPTATLVDSVPSEFVLCDRLRVKKKMEWAQAPGVLYSGDPRVTGDIEEGDYVRILTPNLSPEGAVRIKVYPHDDREVGNTDNQVWIYWAGFAQAGPDAEHWMFECEDE